MGRTVTLKIYRTVELADLAQQFLTDHDIASQIEVDEINGGVKLLIDEHDLAKAQDLLIQ